MKAGSTLCCAHIYGVQLGSTRITSSIDDELREDYAGMIMRFYREIVAFIGVSFLCRGLVKGRRVSGRRLGEVGIMMRLDRP
jgi:hypothetical protein